MRVIIDSNVLISDRWLSGPDFRTFLASRSEIGHELLVPQLALDEAVNDLGEQIASQEGEIAKASEKLRSLLNGDYSPPSRPRRDTRVREYRGFLLDRLRKEGARFLGYPKVPHDKVVRRALERRRPFDQKGHDGYRDVLMWHCVLSELRGTGDVAFITSDQDFCAPVVKGTAPQARSLHQQLLQDIRDPKDAPRLFESLRDFVEREVKPREVLSGPDALARDGATRLFDARGALQKYLLGALAKYLLDPGMLGLPPEVEHASVVSVEDVVNVIPRQVRKFANEWIVDVVADCEVRVETYAWQETPDAEEVPFGPASEQEELDDAYPVVLLQIVASFTVRPADWTVTSVEVQSVSPVQ